MAEETKHVRSGKASYHALGCIFYALQCVLRVDTITGSVSLKLSMY